MNTTFRLLFYLKKPKNYQSEPVSVYMRITVNCRRSEISTSRTWDPERWNTSFGRAAGNKEDARSLNSYLDTLRAKVHEAHRQLLSNNERISAES
jgi:hypothetical protein